MTLAVKNLQASAGTRDRQGFNPWVGKITWRRTRKPTPGILAWKIPWTEEPGGLQSVRS